MLKKLFVVLVCSFGLIHIASGQPQSIYVYALTTASGDTIHFSDFAGKKILIVNTAASSPQAHQYGKLEQLYQLYKDSLVIIAIPSNSFGNEQESDSVINENVHDTYNITYTLATTTNVAGDSIAPLYQWLTDATLNGMVSNPVFNDFLKFLIGTDGKIIGVFSSKVDPMDKAIQDAIKNITEDE